MKRVLFFFIILITFPISAIEVGGHLTEDTIWSPENNPYEVTETLYVDAGVTLTILPGTEVKVSGAYCRGWGEYDQNFWLYNGVSVAKMIWVDGRILAEGTEQDSIIFTRMQDDPDHYWGTIYIDEQAEMCRFSYCIFEYTAGIGIALGNTALGALSIYNGMGLIRNCLFINNSMALVTRGSAVKSLEISGSTFTINNNINTFVDNMWEIHLNIKSPEENYKPALLVDNEFICDRFFIIDSVFFVDNDCTGCIGVYSGYDNEILYFYDNDFNNCETGIDIDHDCFAYIKNNRFIYGYDGIHADEGYLEISDNYLDDCRIRLSGCEQNSKVSRNYINSTSTSNNAALYGNIGLIHDNIIINGFTGLSGSGHCMFSNNIFWNNSHIFSSVTDNHIIENQILLNNDELYNNYLYGNPIFRNCILDFELPPECVDGGGNIWVDSLQAQTLFEDIQNGDFHLIEGSLAIDAGFDTLGYYYPFDLDYNHRVWDGNGDDSAIIDIGPYEYNAQSLGGIAGTTLHNQNEEFVDYVLLKINNQPGEFTFSDSVGNFQIKLPAGIYDVYAERVFYEDEVVYSIVVEDGEFTNLNIYIEPTVDIQDNELEAPEVNSFNLFNYPNPFNPKTTITFNLTVNSDVELSVYNIKAQKIKTLINEFMHKGEHLIIWSGVDDKNNQVSSGIYLYKIKVGDQESVKRMLLLK